MRLKDGIKAQEHGTALHGAGLKKKLRAYPPDEKFKGRPTPKKK